MNNKICVRIKKYDFYEGREKNLKRKITLKKYKEIRSWQKSHTEFSNAFSNVFPYALNLISAVCSRNLYFIKYK